jgi:hypothetical protein
MRKGNVVERSSVNVAKGAWVKAMEFCYDVRHVDISVDHPGITANVVALPFDKVLQAVPAHAHVQYGLYLVFLFAFHEDWRGWGFRASADDRVRNNPSELDDRKDRMQSGETW